MQKKRIMIAVFWIFAVMLFPISSTSFAASMIPASQSSYTLEPLHGIYPYIGSDSESNYYIDSSSCYFSNRDSSVASLGCVIYKVNKGGGDVPLSQLDSYTVGFATYMGNPERFIIVEKVMHNGEDVKKTMTENNSAFFNELFWKVANVTGAPEYWKNQEAKNNN